MKTIILIIYVEVFITARITIEVRIGNSNQCYVKFIVNIQDLTFPGERNFTGIQ